ncbi:hypothetical protein [Corallococcus terminator]|uniref:Uncharacterized protein n=1 Tax=Corallococcus terminator TaxID=2316733 RepID=A0A3A8HYV4_9BACT|nr:hypothetical protein [Corallococcus terminator]RKG76075.1 hypothetical protein D7V88_32700 [Corallococcus terminator]
MSDPSTRCPRCGAPRAAGPECPACGVIYLRAEVRAATRQAEERDAAKRDAVLHEAEDQRLALSEALEAHAVPTFVPLLVAAQPEQDPRLEGITFHTEETSGEGLLEARLRLCVLPAALLVAYLTVRSSGFGGVLRIVLTMPLHELGHAVTAWLCGFSATPFLWVTSVSEERSTLIPLAMAGLQAALVYQGWKRRQWTWMGVGAVLLLAQAVGTLGLDRMQGQALVTFGGDAGMMVLGTALMATFYVPPEHSLRRHALRWGFVAIGAAAFMDGFEQWWAALSHVERIPFGSIDGVGLSDPSKLVQTYGWNISHLIRRYVAVGITCLVALGLLYLGALWRVRGLLRRGTSTAG